MKQLSILQSKQVSGGTSSVIKLEDGRIVYESNGSYMMNYPDAYKLPLNGIYPCVMVPVSGPEGNYSPLELEFISL